MKIAIFTDNFIPGVGGTERAVLGLANELSIENEVAVFCPKYKNFIDNFNFKVIRCPSVAVTKNDRMAFPRLSHKFTKEINNFAPDIIHCQSVSGVANTGLRYGLKHKVPVIFTVHTKFKTAFESGIKSKFIVNKYIKTISNRLNKANLCCTVSYDMVNELNSYGVNNNIQVVKNGMVFSREVLQEKIKNLAKDKFNIQNDKINFLFVGRIVEIKNIDLIIKALENLQQKNIDFQMIFAGVGQDMELYKQVVKEKSLDDKIIFAGNVSDEMLKSLYANSDLFLFPSIFDNDPLVIVESALFNVPALTLFGTGSAERITNEKTGFIAKDEKEFVEMVEELSQNKELLKKCGKEANICIPKEWSVVANEYLNIYNKYVKKDK